MSPADLRRDYTSGALQRSDLNPDPIEQFRIWFNQAVNLHAPSEPNAMTLSTVDGAGHPNARIVLLKGLDERGFLFFTNYESAKGTELGVNPRASLLFYWSALERQVVARGVAERLPMHESETYFTSRPRFNRLAAWASQQSRPIESREALDVRFAQMEARFPGEDVPLPPFWGGYVVRPETVEFWQGRASRLHDRFFYSKNDSGAWQIRRLMP